MAVQRKRRVQQPLRKQSMPQKKRRIQRNQRRKRSKRSGFEFKDGIIKMLIVFFMAINLVLIFFVIKQCSQPNIPEVPISIEEKPTGPLQIEVLNGCGVSGIASQFTDLLRLKGFDVVRVENYESFNVLRTVVINRRGHLKNGVKIAEALGLNEGRVLQEVNDAYLIDASVILGKDYRQLSSWEEMRN